MTCSLFLDEPLAQEMLEVSPAAVAVVDDGGTIQFVNQNFTQMLGYTVEEIVGHSCKMVLPDTDCCDMETHVAYATRQTEICKHDNNMAVCARGKDGSNRRVILSVHEVVTSRQEPRQGLWVFNLLGENRHPVNRSQLESERLAAVTQMVSGLAHESRNSMQTAVACLDLLELDLESNSNLLLLAGQIRASLADLLRNYDEVRQYAEPIRLKLEPANLMSLCRGAFHEMSLSQGVFLHRLDFLVTPDDEPIGMFDQARMKCVFMRLFENAIDAAHGPARIEANYSRIRWRDRDALALDLRDFGIGFCEKTLEHAFEPFYTTKQHGTGLGLSVCRRIVEAHEGDIAAANNAQGGAVIRINIPLKPRK